MNTKRIVAVIAILSLSYLAFDLIRGGRSIRAAEQDGTELGFPGTDGTWNSGGRIVQSHPNDVLHPLASGNGTKAAPVRYRPQSDGRHQAEQAMRPHESVAAETIRAALPWLAGALGFAGLGLVGWSLLAQRRLRSGRLTRSAVRLYTTQSSRTRRPAQAALVLQLAHAKPQRQQPLVDDHKEEDDCKLRHAA